MHLIFSFYNRLQYQIDDKLKKLGVRMKMLKTMLLVVVTVTFFTGCSLVAKKKSDCICGFPGMRVLEMEVYQNEKLVLKTMFDAPDCRKAPFFWERSGDVPFASSKEINMIKPDKKNLLQATLKGEIIIKIFHVKRLITEAKLEDLTLIRTNEESIKWHLSQEDVERAKKAAGL